MNDAGNVIIKVDNSSSVAPACVPLPDSGRLISVSVTCSDVAYGGLRDSVRITTDEAYGMGSLFVIDTLHTPYGVRFLRYLRCISLTSLANVFGDLVQCSVWGAMWTHARSWPSGGECDIFEGVNLQSQNQVALHTVAGCYAPSADTSTSPNGLLQSTNCDYTVNANQGCTYTDARNASYGAQLAANGGGIFAMEMSSDAISVWFFPVRYPQLCHLLRVFIADSSSSRF